MKNEKCVLKKKAKVSEKLSDLNPLAKLTKSTANSVESIAEDLLKRSESYYEDGNIYQKIAIGLILFSFLGIQMAVSHFFRK